MTTAATPGTTDDKALGTPMTTRGEQGFSGRIDLVHRQLSVRHRADRPHPVESRVSWEVRQPRGQGWILSVQVRAQ